MIHSAFWLSEKYPSFLKGRFLGVEDFYFFDFKKISRLLRLEYGFLFIVTMRSDVDGMRSIANHVAEKIPLILSKEDFGWVVKCFFAFFEKSASCSNQNRSHCLCGRCIPLGVKFMGLKMSPHSSKGEIEGLIAKNFSAFRRIFSLSKSRELCLCRWTGVLRTKSESVVTEKTSSFLYGKNRGGCREKLFAF